MCGFCAQIDNVNDCGFVGLGEVSGTFVQIPQPSQDSADVGNTIPGGPSPSSPTISYGQTIDESIDFSGDSDWFLVSLTPGNFTVAVTGTTGGVSLDPVIRFYSTDGELILALDDGPGNSSEHSLIANGAFTVYLEVTSGGRGTTDTGGYSVTLSGPPAPIQGPVGAIQGVNSIDDSNPVQIYFAQQGEQYTFDGTTYVTTGLTGYEQAQLTSIFAGIETFADIDFEFTTDSNAADLIWGTAALPSTSQGTLLGFFNFPNSAGQGGFGLLNEAYSGWNEIPGGQMDVGGFMYGVAIHEIGHGLGLGHTHDAGLATSILQGVGSSGDLGDFNLNQTIFTAMSYNDGWLTSPDGTPGTRNYGYAETFGALDIAALQAHYGANETHAIGDDIYDLAGSNQTGTGYSALWDTGGNDTIRHLGVLDTSIDLRAATLEYETGGGGFVSHVAGVHGGFTIANGVVIENAVSASGDDHLIGNSADNTLSAGAGSDTVQGGAGNDSIVMTVSETDDFDIVDGSSGQDTFDLSDLEIAVWVDLSFIAADGEAWTRDQDNLMGGVWRAFADLAGIQHLVGTGLSDILRGDGDANTLDGGRGSDQMFGGDGDDTLLLSASAPGDVDRLDGGNGDDLADFSSSNIAIWIDLDFGVEIGEIWTQDDLDVSDGVWRAIGQTKSIEDVIGTAVNDEIHGDRHANVLDGGAGADLLSGAGGSDTLIGGEGADTLRLWQSNAGDFDTLIGNEGADVIDLSEFDHAIWIDLTYSASNWQVWTRDAEDVVSGAWRAVASVDGIENVLGTDFSDEIFGDEGANTISAGNGDDTLTGRAGSDLFVFDALSGAVTITDFSADDNEKIDLSAVTLITDFADLLSNHVRSDDLTGEAVLHAGSSSIHLSGYVVSDIGADGVISASDFLF